MSTDRQRLLRLIHVARRELVMDEDTYRGILQRVGNAASAADLDESKLQKVLDHMKACGFKVRPNNRRVSRPLASTPSDKKIRALWLFAHELGIVRDPSERALAAYVKRLAGVDALQWTDGDQVLAIIESLKAWIMRHLPNKTMTLSRAVKTMPLDAREYLNLQALLIDAFGRGTYDPMLDAWQCLQELDQKYKRRKGQ
ncbi:gp16 family protein [Castellaniella caeni]|uniref:gp16 family protein n=1 Tax=Castellaniella caeni TaxID=266123 RepID=UPI000C9EF054|nr:regulatory protein GemA [Castellaniella caeni]